MQLLDISQVTRRSGVPASTLRYYEAQGLIASVGRHGLRRQYMPGVLAQLSLIAMGKTAGFTLNEIAGMFAPGGLPDIPRDALHSRADALDKQARDLTRLAKMIRHVADCPAPSHLDCPNFQKLMQASDRAQRQGASGKNRAARG